MNACQLVLAPAIVLGSVLTAEIFATENVAARAAQLLALTALIGCDRIRRDDADQWQSPFGKGRLKLVE